MDKHRNIRLIDRKQTHTHTRSSMRTVSAARMNSALQVQMDGCIGNFNYIIERIAKNPLDYSEIPIPIPLLQINWSSKGIYSALALHRETHIP